jgi:uncharacterized protein (TIGR03000 family)
MRCQFLSRTSESILVLLILAVSSLFGQAPIGGIRGPVSGMAAPLRPGLPGGSGYGGYFPYPNVFLPYPGGYGYGGYDPIVASVPSAAYFTYGNTSYTTESPSPLPVYAPRPVFAPLPPPLLLTALLKVQVPPDAEIWLDGRKMRSTGSMRHYRTPPLDPAKEYAYEVRACWRFNDKPVEDVRHIAIHAGATVLVDFTHLDPLVPRPSVPAPPPPAIAK